jgi:hypothetical protein
MPHRRNDYGALLIVQRFSPSMHRQAHRPILHELPL